VLTTTASECSRGKLLWGVSRYKNNGDTLSDWGGVQKYRNNRDGLRSGDSICGGPQSRYTLSHYMNYKDYHSQLCV